MRDLSYLQRLTLFAGLFFASTPVIPDGGGDPGGGGDGGVTTDEGGAGDEAADDSGAEGTGEAGDEGVLEESEQVAEGDETEEAAAAQKPITDEQIAKSLDKLRKTDPKLASALRKEHFQNRDYRRAGTPAEVMEMRDTMESVGGPEGLADISNKADTFAAELTQIADGDTAIIDTLSKDYPQSLAKLIPYGMDKLRQINPAGYERAVSGTASALLRDKGVTSSLVRLGDIIRAGGEHAQKDSFELVQKIIDWAAKTEEYGKSRPAEEGPSDAEKRLQLKEQELGRAQQNIRNREIASGVTTTLNGIISRSLAPYLKGRNLTLEQKQELSSSIYTRIGKSLQADARYQARLKGLIAKGNVQDVQRFVGAKVSEISEKLTLAAWKASGHSGSKAVAAAAGANGRPGVIRATSIPEPSTVDWSKDPGRQRFLRGEATLKNGKIVRWDINNLA